MTVAITVNSKFKLLNGDPSYLHKPGGVGREREAIVDIVLTAEDLSDTTIGRFVVDFSGVGVNFRQVYYCQVIEQTDLTDLFFFTTGTDSDAALGVIDVKQIADGTAQNSASYAVTLKAIIRGI